jgi:hypothetical protein
MSDEQLEKMMSDPEHAWWSEPMTLIFGKATVPTRPWEAIFPDVEPQQKEPPPSIVNYSGPAVIYDAGQGPPLTLALGDPWNFYEHFRYAHKLTDLPCAHGPEIAVKAGSTVGIPLVITRKSGAVRDILLKVTTPGGWKVLNGDGRVLLPEEEYTYWRVELLSPEIPEKALKGRQPDSIAVMGIAGDKTIGQAELRVLLRSSALPQ